MKTLFHAALCLLAAFTGYAVASWLTPIPWQIAVFSIGVGFLVAVWLHIKYPRAWGSTDNPLTQILDSFHAAEDETGAPIRGHLRWYSKYDDTTTLSECFLFGEEVEELQEAVEALVARRLLENSLQNTGKTVRIEICAKEER